MTTIMHIFSKLSKSVQFYYIGEWKIYIFQRKNYLFIQHIYSHGRDLIEKSFLFVLFFKILSTTPFNSVKYDYKNNKECQS